MPDLLNGPSRHASCRECDRYCPRCGRTISNGYRGSVCYGRPDAPHPIQRMKASKA